MDEQHPADLAPADERSADKPPGGGLDMPGHFGLSALELADLAFSVAGAASAPFMRDNPKYVMPAEEIGGLVRELLRERFGFDAAEIPGYRGLVVEAPQPHEGLEQARQTQPESA